MNVLSPHTGGKLLCVEPEYDLVNLQGRAVHPAVGDQSPLDLNRSWVARVFYGE